MACPMLAESVSIALNFLCMPQIPAAVASCGGLTMSACPFLAYEGSGVNHMLGSHHIHVAE